MAHQEQVGFKAFMERFSDDKTCREYLFGLRWPEGFVCPKCGCIGEYSVITSRKRYQCKACRHQTSVIAGTVMDRTHLPLQTWFWAMYLLSHDKRGYSAMQLSRELDLGYDTAWFLLHRIRSAMASRDEAYLLDGIVEFDDTYIGKSHKGRKRGRGTRKSKVIVALSKNDEGKPRYVKMQVVPNLRGKTIGTFAESHIAEGSTIQTDAFPSYRKPLRGKYLHQYQVFDEDSDMLHWLHTIIANMKASISGTFHGLGKKHLQPYLDEFCYRFNRRYFQNDLFPRLLVASLNAKPLRLAALTR